MTQRQQNDVMWNRWLVTAIGTVLLILGDVLFGCAGVEVVSKATIEPQFPHGDSYHAGLHLFCDESDECGVTMDCRGKTRPKKAELEQLAQEHGCKFQKDPFWCCIGAEIHETCLGRLICPEGTVEFDEEDWVSVLSRDPKEERP